jgi:thiosulfate/3-mercaptopyruvate sulfurtransferase
MYKTLIDAATLARLPTETPVCLFDCRAELGNPAGARRNYEAGHLPGATHLDLETDLATLGDGSKGRHPLPDRAPLAVTLARAGLSAGMQAVVYDDQGGAYAARAWWLLRWLGHDAVAVLDGGIQAWEEAGFVLEPGVEQARQAGDFVAGPEPRGWICDVTEIERSAGSGHPLVIDARTAERFAGAPHPLDTVSGHVPGARSRFYRDNLGPDGRFKPAADLRRDFEAVLAGTAPDDVVAQCGSGVTACNNLLAMEVAGLPGARLWPGSWSEWTFDPKRPVSLD